MVPLLRVHHAKSEEDACVNQSSTLFKENQRIRKTRVGMGTHELIVEAKGQSRSSTKMYI